MTYTPTTCGVWHTDHVVDMDAAETFVYAHSRRLWKQDGTWRVWLRKLPIGDDRGGDFGKGKRWYGPTEYEAVWEAANWLYRSWRVPGAKERRIGSKWRAEATQTPATPRNPLDVQSVDGAGDRSTRDT